jgi:hypothetical protein
MRFEAIDATIEIFDDVDPAIAALFEDDANRFAHWARRRGPTPPLD